MDGLPVAQRVSPHTYADYVLSDNEYDPAALAGKWNLNVVSFGEEKAHDVFNTTVEDAKGVSNSIMTCASFVCLLTFVCYVLFVVTILDLAVVGLFLKLFYF